ncbi:MAG: radical SAM protein [Candidatus Omnitrophica bacterium]|jgi:putative pyruvate formate lyase activating enzyme|nr:radical SAM protein [Candidatus Omnitrophota bacterium]MDD5691080.1 radical SAM protein [Candidatus Omnitrophota bacterium]
MLNYPSYLKAGINGKLKVIAEQLFNSLESCDICPRRCKVDRLGNKIGFCKTARLPKVYSYMCHHGEEPPVSGISGSGTIFFSNCNMNCVYCQNYEFSQLGKGREYEFGELAQVMLALQESGCHNINLVTPTHVLPQILKALEIAIAQGLNIPLVYNTGGYELAQTLRLLDGIIDIYLADMRYADNMISQKFSSAPDYPRYNQEAIKEMHRQVGPAEFDKDGLIRRGLIIRHLVLPNQASGTDKIMQFVAKDISEDTYISLMSQYLPYYKASGYPEISRRLKNDEYEEAKRILGRCNLLNGWIQESYGSERFAGVNIRPV